MHSSRSFFGSLALAAASAGIAIAMSPPVIPKSMPQTTARRYDTRRSILGGWIGTTSSGRRFRRGWSNRQVQRMALKRRNQARHRAARRR